MNKGQLIGKGSSSEVFAWGNSQVIKLFNKGFSFSHAEVEATGLRVANALGLPTPAVEEVIEVEGRYGVVLERIVGKNLCDEMHARPWTFFSVAKMFAELYALIHSCKTTELPSQREQFLHDIQNNVVLSDQQKSAAKSELLQLPGDTNLCLGDFRITNILISKDGPIIVDWESALLGNPSADIARLSLGRDVERSKRSFLPHLPRRTELFYRVFLNRYMKLSGTRHEDIVSYRLPVASAQLNNTAGDEDRVALLKLVKTSLKVLDPQCMTYDKLGMGQ